MADPLSMSASIAGLISVVDIVFRAVFKYTRAVKGAKNDINSLAEEINSLSSVLRSLQALALELEVNGDNFDPTLRNHYLSHCGKTIEKIDKRVEKASKILGQSKVGGVIQQLKWPFTTSETKELLVELSRHKQTVNVALSADSMRKLQLCLSKVDELSKQASSIEAIVKRIEINTQIIVDDKKQKVLNYFMKTNPQSNLRKCISDRHPMTGLWLTESSIFTDWLGTPGSRIWLSGIPGAGKTVLAGSVIQEALTRSHETDRVGIGFFFCNYTNSKTCEPSSIFGALASQLALQKDKGFDVLSHYYDELHPPNGLPEETPDPEELRAKICSMSEKFAQTIIIIDGLDECGDTTDTILRILMELAEYGTGVSMALFSRDHADIRFRLEAGFKHVLVAAQEEDIRLYVGAELEKRIQSQNLQLGDMTMKEEIMEKLVKGSKGMFRWVACQIDHLCDCAHDEERREALTKLPPNLPESYRRLLYRVNICSPKVIAMVQLCLQFIAFAEPKLSILQLRQAISTPLTLGRYLDKSNTISEHEISRRCSSLIRKSECGRFFEFAHYSVQEFLEDEAILFATPSLEDYLVSKTRSHALLAAQCLRFLQLKNFDRAIPNPSQLMHYDKDTNERYPFYRYSAIEWLNFTKKGLDTVTLDLAKSIFHPSKTHHFTLWAVEILRYVLYESCHKAYEIISDDGFRPIHLASALNLYEVCDILPNGDADINLPSRVGRPIDLAITLRFGPKLLLKQNFNILRYRKRHNLAIHHLIKKGARISYNLLSSGFHSAFYNACRLVWSFNSDFTPIVALLSLGVVPGEIEMEEFKNQMSLCQNTREAESSTLELIQYLSSASLYETEWGFQIGSLVWQWALEQNFAYTNNPFFVDSRISLSKEALLTKVKTATELDNVDALNNCLGDDRLDLSSLRLDRGRTLLHIAVECTSVDAIGILLDGGCNNDIRDNQGFTPLHMCLKRYNRRVIEQFLARGISLLPQDAKGRTIWHDWAEGNGDLAFLTDVFELDPESTSKALLVKTARGFTPLSLSLEVQLCAEKRAIKLVELGAKIPNFWQSHVPIFGAAARRGCGQLISFLKNVNATLDLVSPGDCTPLHQLDSRAKPDCVSLLLSLFGDTCRWRYRGRLPVELYIENTLQNGCGPNFDIVKALVSLDMFQYQGTQSTTLWDFIEGLQLQNFDYATDKLIASWDQTRLIYNIISRFIELGYHEAYEARHNESIIVLQLSTLLRIHRQSSCTTFSITRNQLHQWIASTRFWSSARESHVVLEYMILAIRDMNLEIVTILVSKGVDIHRRIDSISMIEHACRTFVDESFHIEAYKTMISMFLDMSNKKQLLDLTLDQGLHELANHANTSRFSWLIKQLISRGVSIDAQIYPSNRGHDALVYHIGLDGGCAELLLSIGADPTMPSSTHSSLNAIQLATLRGDLGFLKSVLAHATAGQLSVDWATTFSPNGKVDGKLLNLQGFNVLHIASLAGKIECLRFYLGETAPWPLITEVNAGASLGGYTPLHLAAYCNHNDIINLLLSKGAELMYGDDHRRTPLHWAAEGGHLQAIRLLLEHGSWETFDTFGRKPSECVSGPDSEIILKCLGEAPESKSTNETQPMTHQNIRDLSISLETAIVKNDLQGCISIFTLGCPINVRMPSCLGCSPLILAMIAQEPKATTVEWLIDNGACITKSACQSHGILSPIEIAFENYQLSSLVPKLVDAYLSQGGDLVSGDDYPLHSAVSWQNNEGLELLLECVEKHINSIGRRTQISSQQAMCTIMNRRMRDITRCNVRGWSKSHTAEITALHFASAWENKEAVSLLVKKGASIDIADSNGWTPLAYSRSIDMTEHLISLGASTAAVYGRFPLSPLISVWGQDKSSQLFPVYFGDAWQFPAPKKSLLSKMSSSVFPMVWEAIAITSEHILLLTQLGNDLTSEHNDGSSWMHRIMCQEHSSDFILDGNFGLSGTTPFPWHLEWCLFGSIAFLRSRFSEFQQKLPHEVFQRILNLEPERGWSPLCRAACLDLVDVMENCLSMGAQVDFEGCPAGSALIIAGICGSFDAVKLLVHHHQAAICYEGKDGPMSVLSLTGSKSIIEWLLVKRFTESLRIELGSQHFHSDQVPKERPWSGIAQAKLRLVGKWEMQPHESSLDYAKRLAELRKRWKGKVVPIYDSLVYPP